MHTTKIEIPIRPLSEIFPHLEFYQEIKTGRIAAVTHCPGQPNGPATKYARWAFAMYSTPASFNMPLISLENRWIRQHSPEMFKTGTKLMRALHGWKHWQDFVQQVVIPDEYAGKLEFWLEYSPEKAPYKEAAYPNSSTGNVTAVRPQSLAGIWFNTYECYTAGHGVEPNAEQIHSIRIGEAMLHDRCVQITEKEARIIHPNLFGYLKENFKK